MKIDYDKLSREDNLLIRLLMLDYEQARSIWPDHKVFSYDDEGLNINYMGGACPTQSEGQIQGVPFYYRARHGSWYLSIGADPVMDGEIKLVGDDPHAGFVPDEDVMPVLLMGNALMRYLKEADALTS